MPAALVLGAAFAESVGGWVVLAAERGAPARFGARELAVATREACARVLFLLTTPLSWGPEPLPAPSRRPPVLLVPGHRAHRAAFAFLRVFLARRGWDATYAVSLPWRTETLPELGRAVGREVEALCRATGAERVDVVAQGTGGLAVAWYLRHLDGAARVRRLVTLGTPWAGSRTAVFDRGRAPIELSYRSPLLDGLAPPAVATFAIVAGDDPIVVPTESAAPDGATVVRLDGAGHVEMLLNARVFRAVQVGLEAAEPSP